MGIGRKYLHTKIHLEERWEEHFIVNQNHSLDIARRQKMSKKDYEIVQ